MRVVGAILFALFSTLVLAQTGTSTISGTVKDASDAAIPSARVKITNLDTGVPLETVGNSAR